jgi:Fuc2NAc and GlcNAc transferase
MKTTILALATFFLSLLITRWLRGFASNSNLFDVPNSRSSHTVPTPRGGGLAIVLSFFVALLALSALNRFGSNTLIVLFGGGGVIACVGFLDDWRNLPAKLRFGVQILSAFSAVWLLGGLPAQATSTWVLHERFIRDAIAILTLVWATNLFNFMDGIDGIAGSEAIFICAIGAGLNWSQHGDPALTAAMVCLASASLGFLVFNLPPARIFMGDVGSGFLGFVIAVLGLAISRSAAIPIVVWGILAGVFVVDSSVTLARRVVRGDRWFEAHRMHAYQRLSRRWKSHARVTLATNFVNVAWLLPWALIAVHSPERAIVCLAAAWAPLIVFAFVSGAGTNDD